MKIGVIASRKLVRGTVREEEGQIPTNRSVGRRFLVFTFLGKAGKRWKWSARVSPVAKEKAEDSGRKANTQMQKMAENRLRIDEVEDMETEMSPECKLVAQEQLICPRVVSKTSHVISQFETVA